MWTLLHFCHLKCCWAKAERQNMWCSDACAGHYASERLNGRNSWTDWAREPVKPSLDTGHSKKSIELPKNFPLHSKFLRKIQICEFSIVIFWQVSEKIKKFVPCIRFSLSNPFSVLCWRLKNPRTQCCQTHEFGLFFWGKLGVKKCGLVWLRFRSRFSFLRKMYRGEWLGLFFEMFLELFRSFRDLD